MSPRRICCFSQFLVEVGRSKKSPRDGYSRMTTSGLVGTGTVGTGTIFVCTDSHICRCIDGRFSPYVALVHKAQYVTHVHTYSMHIDICSRTGPEKIAGTDPGRVPVLDPSRIRPGFFCRDPPLLY